MRSTASATSDGASPPRSRPRAASRGGEPRGVACEDLDVLAQLGADQPREVLDGPFLPAGDAIAVVQQEDHRRLTLTSARRGTRPLRSSSRPADGRDYLAVALDSVAPQAAAPGAEIVVVEDDARDPAVEAVAVARGARYVALGAPRGLNVARNAAIEAASGELLCFLDDDVAVWPGWLAALLAAAASCPRHEAFGGPIRARFEGGRTCTPAGASRCR